MPSPKVWRDYLYGLKLDDIQHINFRDKKISWENYGLSIQYGRDERFFQMHDDSAYMQLFLHGLIVRPSCFSCPAKGGKSRADFIIGDFWGLDRLLPNIQNDHKGIDFVVCQAAKAQNILASINNNKENTIVNYDDIIRYNGGLTQAVERPNERVSFWKAYSENVEKSVVIMAFSSPYLPTIIRRIKRSIHRLLSILNFT